MKNFIKRFLRAIFVLITSVLSLPFLLVTLLVLSITLLFNNDDIFLTIKERYGLFYKVVWYGLLMKIDYIKYGGYEALVQLHERLES